MSENQTDQQTEDSDLLKILAERDLKITGLTQRLSEIVTEYEVKIVDLRVALTGLVNEKEQAAGE